MHWMLLLSAIALAIVGQGLLKGGSGAPSFIAQLLHWQTIAGVGVYGLSTILYISALRRIPLTVAFPCTALSYIAVALVGLLVFNEPLGTQRMGGLALIGIGVLVLATS